MLPSFWHVSRTLNKSIKNLISVWLGVGLLSSSSACPTSIGPKGAQSPPVKADFKKYLVLHLPMQNKVDPKPVSLKNIMKDHISHLQDDEIISRGLKACARFDSPSDKITIPNNKVFDVDDEFSVSMWVKPKSHVDANGRRSVLFAKWCTSPQHGDFSISFNDRDGKKGVISLKVGDRLHGKQVTDQLVGVKVVPLNEWSHISATISKGNMRLYINGKLDAEKNSLVKNTERAEYPNDGITIGGLPWGGSEAYAFYGEMSDIRLYNSELHNNFVEDLFWSMLVPSAKSKKSTECIEADLCSSSASIRFSAINEFLRFSDKEQKRIQHWFELTSSNSVKLASEVDKQIESLKCSNYLQREKAFKKLLIIGQRALPCAKLALKKAQDPELKMRFGELIKTKDYILAPSMGLESIKQAQVLADRQLQSRR